MAVSSIIASDTDVRAFIDEYSKLGKEPTKTGFCPTMLKPCRWRFRARSSMERRPSEINLFAPLSLAFPEIVTS